MNGYAKIAIACFAIGLVTLSWMGVSYASSNWPKWFPPFSCPAGQVTDSSESECFVQPTCGGNFQLTGDNETCELKPNVCHPDGQQCPAWVVATWVNSECCETWWYAQFTIAINSTRGSNTIAFDCDYYHVGVNATLYKDWIGVWKPNGLPSGCGVE